MSDEDEQAETPEQPVNKLPGTAPLAELTEQLHERRGKARLGGGLEKIEAQHARGKLTARERLDLLVDEVELKKRAAGRAKPPETPARGYSRLYAKEITGADMGCDFRFLRPE